MPTRCAIRVWWHWIQPLWIKPSKPYFEQSEQLPSRLLLACDGQRAAGLLLQKLPGEEVDEDGFRRASALFDTLGREELLAPPAGVIHRLFHEESPQLLGEQALTFACSCSRERVEAMLVSLGREEADAAVVAARSAGRPCAMRICGQAHHFDAVQISRLMRPCRRCCPPQLAYSDLQGQPDPCFRRIVK